MTNPVHHWVRENFFARGNKATRSVLVLTCCFVIWHDRAWYLHIPLQPRRVNRKEIERSRNGIQSLKWKNYKFTEGFVFMVPVYIMWSKIMSHTHVLFHYYCYLPLIWNVCISNGSSRNEYGPLIFIITPTYWNPHYKMKFCALHYS